MIKIIIFSFDRALQLEALLASVRKYWNKTEYNLSVIYNTSHESFEQGYQILKNQYSEYNFIKETENKYAYPWQTYFSLFNVKKLLRYPHTRKQKTNFRELVIKETNSASCEYVMFLTDDSVFIKDVFLSNEDLSFIDNNPFQNQLSLRLGKNITEKPADISCRRGKIEWDFHLYRQARSWGYNFSVDAHIYSKKLITGLVGKIIFNNPTTLEGHLNNYVQIHNLANHGRTFEEPFILSFPINMVQNIAHNESLHISTEQLNKMFIEGKRLEYIVPAEILEFQQYPEEVVLRKGDTKEYLKLK